MYTASDSKFNRCSSFNQKHCNMCLGLMEVVSRESSCRRKMKVEKQGKVMRVHSWRSSTVFLDQHGFRPKWGWRGCMRVEWTIHTLFFHCTLAVLYTNDMFEKITKPVLVLATFVTIQYMLVSV